MKKRSSYLLAGIASLLFMFSCNSEEIPDLHMEVPEDETGELIVLNSGATVEYKHGKYYWSGDIMLSDTQLKVLDETGDIITSGPQDVNMDNSIPMSPMTGYTHLPYDVNTRSVSITPTPYNMWAMVRFAYGDVLNPRTKDLIIRALNYYEQWTNVRFYNATDQPTHDPVYGMEYPLLYFCDGSENASYVGRIGGKQEITFVPYGCYLGTVYHEIGHALGLLHEHQRADRDNFITVNFNNIDPQKRHNFEKRTTDYYLMGDFEFGSIMMYSSFTGAEIDRSIPSMTRKDGTVWTAQRGRTTEIDRILPRTFYLPYIARSDTYKELDTRVYKPNGTLMTAQERLQLQKSLNDGKATPPAGGRIENNF